MRFRGKVVVVTGGSSGIGLAIAEAFARDGAQVAISGRDAEKLENADSRLRGIGGEVLSIAGDVSLEEDCRKLIETVIENWGGVDILINNAGMSMRSLFRDTEVAVLQRLMDVNFWGAVHCTKFAYESILARGGSIVGISSIAGYKGLPARSGYSASKFALNGFLESLRIENLRTGVHVLTCAPGFTASNIRNTALKGDGTPQTETPLNESRLMQPATVAKHLLQAIEKRQAELILTRQGKLTVLMNKLLPRWLDGKVWKVMASEKDSPLV